MQQDKRLKIWIERGNVSISQLFFQHYKQLLISDSDAMVILHMIAFQEAGNHFPTPTDIANRMQQQEKDVTDCLRRLMQKGLFTIEQSTDENKVLHERFSFYPLWERLIDVVEKQAMQTQEQEIKQEEGEIFSLFEQEFGRFLSPMEFETIGMWIDKDGHSAEIIRAALREAVLAQKMSLRYIDRILFEWKKKNVKTMRDVERQTKAFRPAVNATAPQTKTEIKHVPFYNWLEERE
ncbi:DNA replication protein [Sporosarcina sp. P37]|uniref:DnaD domain-containing protein n=1 Tax=unclassified Sporosarcina TaxID=2647733 RepID=UPI0009BFE38F|nr:MULTISPECIES: DnaD domain-containing protein [unclassified Sporosarcina]ARD49478.1 DNA replication protein [Sporosarcina sp. P33]ARK25953.1 DNA replication protein [Sporosarcina sp. P37]PID18226.1 DNA replication protein [Sporosarcina sp. P35]